MTDHSNFLVAASAKAKPGKEKELERALRDVAEPTRAQPGSILFSLYRSPDDPSVTISFERWALKDDHERHLQGARVQRLMLSVSGTLAEPAQISSYEVVDER